MASQFRRAISPLTEQFRAGAPRILRLIRCAAQALIAFSPALMPVTAFALSWEYVPQFRVGAQYETNPGYDTGGSESNEYAGTLFGALAIKGASPRSRYVITPQIGGSYFPGGDSNEEDLNTLDYSLPVSASWTEERATYGLDAGYSYISTNDYNVTDPNTPPVNGVYGRIVVNDDQRLVYANPSASFQITPRDEWGVSLGFSDVHFDDAAFTGRSNYDSANASTSWTRSLNLQSIVTASVSVSLFDAKRPSRLLIPGDVNFINPSLICRNSQDEFILCSVKNETESYSANLGYQYTLTPVSTLGITAGVAYSDIKVSGTSGVDSDQDASTPDLPCYDPEKQEFTSCELKTSANTFIGRIFFNQRSGDTITRGFSIGRSIEPSSDGAVVTTDLVNAYLQKQFSARLSGALGASYISQEAVGASASEQAARRFDTKYERLDATLTWSLSRTWSLSTFYYFSSDEQRSGDSYTVNDNTIGVYAAYAGIASW